MKEENGKKFFTGYSCCMNNACNTYENVVNQLNTNKVLKIFENRI